MNVNYETAKYPWSFTYEMLEIASENNVSWDIGLDMMTNNVRDAKVEDDPYFYHGADWLEYLKMQPMLPDPTKDVLAVKATAPFKKVYRENRAEIAKLRLAINEAEDQADKQAAYDKLVAYMEGLIPKE